MNISRQQLDKLVVGTNDVSYVPPDTSPTGTAVLNGPVYIGDTAASPGYEAVLNVASNAAAQSPLDTQPRCNANLAVKVDGDSKFVGDGKTGPDAITVIGDMFVSGAVDCGNKGKLASRFAAADASPKPFDLVHPTKGKGHRLRYACIEGPEVGVYYRGRLKNDTEIVLPYYWKDLVHTDSITVQLQPIGAHQDIIVKRWDAEKIYLQAKPGFPINCFYHVYAERKDINPLIVEYKGDSWKDYPDPNFNPDTASDPEDPNRFNDPEYRGNRNIITS